MKKLLLLWAVSVAVLALVQPWGGFSDPDAFYHAKTAELILEHGPITAFPWLDLTTLGQGFVDQHFLFHLALLPFVKLFGAFEGNQIAAVVFGSVFSLTLYFLLREMKVRKPEFWALVCLVCPPLLMRLSLGKASPLAIGLFLAGLVGFEKRWTLGLLAIGAVYVLTHAGWPLLLLVIVLMMACRALFDHWIFGTSRKELQKTFIEQGRTVAWLVAGVLIGILVHPNREHLLSFIWTQVFQIGVATPYGRVIMGNEWYGYAPLDLLKGSALIVIAVLVLFYAVLFCRKKSLARESVLNILCWTVSAGMLLVLTLKSARFSEYFVPLAVFSLAFVSELVDFDSAKKELASKSKWLLGLIAVLILVAIGRGVWGVRSELWDTRKPFTRFDGAIAAIRQATLPGERIFHSDWAQFPILFAKAPEYRYVAGLDPTFLLSASSTLSDDYTKLTLGTTTSTAFETISHEFDAKIVFIEKRDSSKIFEETIEHDARFEEVYEDGEADVFRIRP